MQGATNDGIITYNSGLIGGEVESALTFDTSRTLAVSGSMDVYAAARIRGTIWTGNTAPVYITAAIGTLAVSQSLGGSSGDLMYYNGISWIKLA